MKEHVKSSPNWTPRPNGLNSVWAVILHHTATGGDTGQAVANYFATRAAEVSAHVVIDEHGEVWRCVDISKAAWHAGQCRRVDWDRDGKLEDWEQYVNSISIGIEFCNRGGSDSYPNAQIYSAAMLIRRWDAKCPNLKLRNITDHAAVNLNGKVDVSATFPAARLFWYILHPYKAPPANIYAALPSWAQHQVDQIKK
jgi:N-acetyl-anhydromuramyl-L-alanine amidase AmpD